MLLDDLDHRLDRLVRLLPRLQALLFIRVFPREEIRLREHEHAEGGDDDERADPPPARRGDVETPAHRLARPGIADGVDRVLDRRASEGVIASLAVQGGGQSLAQIEAIVDGQGDLELGEASPRPQHARRGQARRGQRRGHPRPSHERLAGGAVGQGKDGNRRHRLRRRIDVDDRILFPGTTRRVGIAGP